VDDHLRVPVRPSRLLSRLILIAHAVAAAGLFLSGAQPWMLAGGCAALLASGAWHVRSAIRAGHGASVLDLGADGCCAIAGAQDAWGGLLRTDSIALPWLVVLRIDRAGGGGARSLVLLRDSLEADDWRRLRVFLRWAVRFDGAARAPSDARRRAGRDSPG
jgi:toxin CptA